MTDTLKLHYPTKPYPVGQRFGDCWPSVCSFYKQIGLDGHNGIDSGAVDGMTVYAAHDGVVTFSGEDGSAGLGVVVRTVQPFAYKESEAFYKTIYWHLKVGGIWVKPTQLVKAGDPLGLADNTGFSTGTHLHFGLKPLYPGEQDWEWWNAENTNGFKGAVDPMPFFTGKYAVDEFRHTFEKSLDFADEGADVRALQVVLQAEGDFPIDQEITTFFGRVTQAAVKSYQRRNSIVSWGTPYTTGYGRMGPKTRVSINSKYGV